MVKKYSSAERKSFKNGFFAGLFKGKKKSNSSSKVRKKPFGFLAFNENCDVFNVDSYGVDRKDALRNAKKHLKRDPEIPNWGVTITNDNPDPSFFRRITVMDGKVFDNWTSHYRKRDSEIRAKYKDLSKPVKGYHH